MDGQYWLYFIMSVLTIGSILVVDKEKKTLLYHLGCGVLILLFVAQEAGVGIDLPEYMFQYNAIQELPVSEYFNHKFEIGYVLLNKLLSLLFEGDRILLVAVGLISLVPFYHYFNKESVNPMLSLMLFVALGFYAHVLTLYRQMCAMAVLTFSYRFIREHKLTPFILTVLFAMTFHRTAGVFVIVYLAELLPVNKWLILTAILGSLAVGLLGEPIMHFVNHFVMWPTSKLYEGGISMLFVLWIAVFICYWLLKPRMEDGRVKIPFIMLLFSAATQPIAFTFSNWARIVLYFSISLVVLLPELYDAVFCQMHGNKLLEKLEMFSQGAYNAMRTAMQQKWFHVVIHCIFLAVLVIWFRVEIYRPYILAPVNWTQYR